MVVIAVIYCIVTGKRRVKRGEFRGFADSIQSGALSAPTYWEQSQAVELHGRSGKSNTGVKKKRGKKFYKSEERCREIFQEMFGVKFKSVRPKWLKNPVTGKNLELDGYNKTVVTPLGRGLAFEYDGEQHAKYNKHYHRSGEAEFHYQVKKDEYKDVRCKEEGVLLLRIPHYIAYGDLARFIHTKLKKKMGASFTSAGGRAPMQPGGRYVWGGRMSSGTKKLVQTSGLYGY